MNVWNLFISCRSTSCTPCVYCFRSYSPWWWCWCSSKFHYRYWHEFVIMYCWMAGKRFSCYHIELSSANVRKIRLIVPQSILIAFNAAMFSFKWTMRLVLLQNEILFKWKFSRSQHKDENIFHGIRRTAFDNKDDDIHPYIFVFISS